MTPLVLAALGAVVLVAVVIQLVRLVWCLLGHCDSTD